MIDFDDIQDFEAILEGIINVTIFGEVSPKPRMQFPQCVKTKWFSRSDAIFWLSSRQGDLPIINVLRARFLLKGQPRE
jgi:hypothetical protein